MSTSSGERQGKPIDKPTAWACTWANLLVAPGLGSITAGRKVGYVQIVMAVIGLSLSASGLIWFWRDWVAQGEFPEGFTRPARVAAAGVALFVAAWLWALLTSIRLHGEAKQGKGENNR